MNLDHLEAYPLLENVNLTKRTIPLVCSEHLETLSQIGMVRNRQTFPLW